ncbi:uncharacterized protein LOC107363765 [Tetranychus urticae]|uniref:tryptophan--tRNA ligase n=1 Tax=Tetranychus urticae TaxID=32264 RepID=T1KFI3_TETUR|nr:uncharacterized protein LOC107363765 [Tetranychus urticae]
MFDRLCSRLIISNRFKLVKHFRFYSEEKVNTVVSAIQPTGPVHLGNYFGAIKIWLDLQNDPSRQCIFNIADLHSITLPHDPISLKNNIITLAATLLASGIDAEKCTFFQQSRIYHHTQLTWILLSLLSFGRLSHLPQYKEKSTNLKEIPLTLLLYPVLQASDIILYKGNEVPVGNDQLPHLHVARDLVEKFNRIYGFVFPEPKPLMSDDAFACKVRSLRKPEKKMSKSEATPKGRIDITDPPEVIRERIMKAVTDCHSNISYDFDGRPGVSNLISIHKLCSGLSIDQICSEARSLTTEQYKSMLADLVIEYFKPIRFKYLDLLKNVDYISAILNKGSTKAEMIAENTMSQVNSRIGLIPYK